jgi:nicotinate-nucleotide adenylyltransferase
MGDFVMQIGLLGGTFNPIHFGHINLALELKEKKALDAVWFIPALLSPFRTQDPPQAPAHRLKMIHLAIESIPGFEVCTIELERPPPSYTIDTLKTLLALYPNYFFNLLLSEDLLLGFEQWRESLEIIRLVPLWIGSRLLLQGESRLNNNLNHHQMGNEIVAAMRKGLIPTRQFDISASLVRERLKNRLYCGHLLPAKVLDYISTHQLYFNPLT